MSYEWIIGVRNPLSAWFPHCRIKTWELWAINYTSSSEKLHKHHVQF